MKKFSYISSDPSIMRGALVITGTRVPIVRILYLLKEGYTLKDVQAEYPQVSLDTLQHVIDALSTQIDKIEENDNPFLQA